MSLSENIKKFRIASGYTQEQLAEALGVSAQAVSKWETSDTYPDGSLLLPLAKQLDVSLDELFGNDEVSMSDISRRLIELIKQTESSERFELLREICWQLERGMFNTCMPIETKYDPNELKELVENSYIFNDFGFTLISNGKEPFFAVFPEPKEGFGNFLKNEEELLKIFSALSHQETMRAIKELYKKGGEYVFEASVLARKCDIPPELTDRVMTELITLRIVTRMDISVNGVDRVLYSARPNFKLIALLLMSQELVYRGTYCLMAEWRNKPIFRSE